MYTYFTHWATLHYELMYLGNPLRIDARAAGVD